MNLTRGNKIELFAEHSRAFLALAFLALGPCPITLLEADPAPWTDPFSAQLLQSKAEWSMGCFPKIHSISLSSCGVGSVGACDECPLEVLFKSPHQDHKTDGAQDGAFSL